ncbi:hypothetical protein ONZ43_g779 [Nemania bipapillata]|uniref:Uncharacterized protein n=1 Tax=Nemania bipapillata TaxID=110536 RepID=A0ACC2J7S5_9PEZI|nr:hypothetical protein ONZ43_g779 [Nemania bipapillata]
MANRPNFIDLRSGSSNTVNTSSSSRPLRSPRLHVAGEVPPALSPLDAFAAQSRLLAKQLEESARNGNRVSRLPPLTTDSPLIVQGRSEYFRSLSYDSTDEQNGLSPKQPAGLGLTTEIETPLERPRSMHPRMSRIPATPDENIPVPPNPFKDGLRGRSLQKLDEDNGMYGARREQSPGDLESESRSASVQGSLRHASPSHGRFPASPEKLTKTASNDSAGLIPPRSLFPKRSSSIMSAPLDTYNDDNLSASFHSQPPRKLSSSSAFSGPVLTSPIAHYQRSPSVSSDASAPLPRPSFNFSRPLSRAGTPSFDAPSRQASSDSHPSFVLADDTAHTPVSMHSDAFAEGFVAGGDAAPSYIYSKYSLPRGKSLQRNSALLHEGDSSSSFALEAPSVPVGNRQAPPSPPTRPSSSSSRYQDGVMMGDSFVGRPSLERSKLSTEIAEMVEDEDHAKDGKTVDFVERKTRKAQFALSIYELGVSHMNGWGIEQDKALALRCFEISGNWGDVDALAEAGFCYAQGIGCKKDLKKSAKFYRMAEAKGMSMPGNSWEMCHGHIVLHICYSTFLFVLEAKEELQGRDLVIERVK